MLNSKRNKSLRIAPSGLLPVAMGILDGKCSMVYNFTADQHVFSMCESPGEFQLQFRRILHGQMLQDRQCRHLQGQEPSNQPVRTLTPPRTASVSVGTCAFS